MKILACILLLLCIVPATGTTEPVARVRTFYLEGVRSGRLHGPFTFTTGTAVNLETGTFRLDVLSAAGNFILTEERTGTVFGVYELVPGRMIDAGYQLFTITRLSSTTLRPGTIPARPPVAPGSAPPRPRSATAGSALFAHDYKVGIVADLIHQIAYEAKIDGQEGARAKYIERRGATLFAARGILTLTAGLLADVKWQETIDDPAGRFEQGTLASGTGWTASMQLRVPAWADGRWSASLGGGVHYQREAFDLEYGSWETVRIDSPITTNDVPNDPTNGLTNGVPEDLAPVPVEQFVRHSRTATLSETWVSLTARLDYTAPTWFVFGGLRALPWVETDLSAAIEIDNQRIPLSFKRRDPFSGYAGAGFSYQDIHSYVEFEAGGVNALRIGIMLSF